MNSIYEYNLDELEKKLVEINEKKYRAKQLFFWLYERKINNFNEMDNINKELKKKINNNFYIDDIKLIKQELDEDVCKFLFELKDNNLIETVVMFHDYGNSVCVSSQVGCNMGCKFCESGTLKKVRNLTTSEMVNQVLQVGKILQKKITHVVVMGIGEPLDNFDNLCKFIKIINNPFGLKIGSRHITVSTCGIVPKIKKLIDFPFQINLAISLHASNNCLRDTIMPINKVYNIESVLEILKEYFNNTKRRITFEYILLNGINDKEENAYELAKLLKNLNCYVNLIPYNETSHLTYKRSKTLSINTFYDILKKEGINVTKRREFGSKISAACGQLRSNKER